MTPAEFTNFHRSVFRLCTHGSVDGSIHFRCMDGRHIREILDRFNGSVTIVLAAPPRCGDRDRPAPR